MSSSRPTKWCSAGRAARLCVYLMFPRGYLESLISSTLYEWADRVSGQGWGLRSGPPTERAAGDNSSAQTISRHNQAHFYELPIFTRRILYTILDLTCGVFLSTAHLFSCIAAGQTLSFHKGFAVMQKAITTERISFIYHCGLSRVPLAHVPALAA